MTALRREILRDVQGWMLWFLCWGSCLMSALFFAELHRDHRGVPLKAAGGDQLPPATVRHSFPKGKNLIPLSFLFLSFFFLSLSIYRVFVLNLSMESSFPVSVSI